MQVVQFLLAHWQEILLGVSGVISGVIAIALIVPGPEPEASLQKVLDFLSKFSRK